MLAKDWKETTATPELYGGKGMGAQRAAWTAAFQAENARYDDVQQAVVMLDLVKAFERIPHSHLWHQAGWWL